MRIAQVAPLYESVPPRYYGGTERVVSYLIEELTQLGHDVTLFASGDSKTSARLVPMAPCALRLDGHSIDPIARHIAMIEEVCSRRAQFDMIHFHIDYLHFPTSRHLHLPHVTTLHGRLDIPDLAPVYERFADMPVISISQYQRRPLLGANWIGNVPHGLPHGYLRFNPNPDGYLAFLGRICPEKRVDRAIAIAKAVGMPLKIAAKVDPVDEEYFERDIRPLLDDPLVEYIGEIGEAEKLDFLGPARAVLFPIDWPEPFGLVMIEALACGTPVVAFRQGSVPEVIEHGRTGFIVDSVDEAIAATRRIDELDRRHCREAFERRFTARRMAERYLRIYADEVQRQAHKVAIPPSFDQREVAPLG